MSILSKRVPVAWILIALLVILAVFWAYRTEKAVKIIQAKDQAIINILAYNVQLGILRDIPQQTPAQAQQAQPAPTKEPEPKKK